MLLVREVFHCKPGKVKPLVEKFLAMQTLNERTGFGRGRIMTDVAGPRYWTVVAEFEVPSMAAFEQAMEGGGMDEETGKEFEKIMKGYHDLIDHGHREIYKIEG